MRRAAAAFALIAAAGPAHAQDQDGQETPIPLPGEEPAPVPLDLWVDPMMRRTWVDAPRRTFLSATLDLGWVYLRPRLSLGYGRPFYRWVGIDANPIVSSAALGAYGGVRVNLPRLTWRAGARFSAALHRKYLDPDDSYDRMDVNIGVNDRADLLTYETEAEGSLPIGKGDIVALGSLSYVTNVPDGMYAFEETLRVVVCPPWVWRGRAGYLRRFGKVDQHSAGVVVDVLGVPERDGSLTVRVGPLIRIVLSRRVEVRGSFIATVVSPDRLGLKGSDFTELGLRYRWATE